MFTFDCGTGMLTTGNDALVGTTGDDTFDATVVGTLGSLDTIFDPSTTDNDVLNAKITGSVAPTIKNVETINLQWDSNAALAFDATSIVNASINFDAVSMAFAGTATINGTGTNNLAFNSDVTGSLTANGVVTSNINTGNATSLTLAKGTHPDAAGKTSATVTVNKSMDAANAITNSVEELTISSTLEGAKLDFTSADIIDKLTITGDKSIVVQTDLNQAQETIINQLTGSATLTVISDTTGAIDISKIEADEIHIATATGAAAVTVANNQTIVTKVANAIEDINEATTAVNATVNVSTGYDIATLDVTGVKTVNITATADVAIGGTSFVTDDANQINLFGSKQITLKQAASTSASIDASAMTGKFIYTSDNTSTGVTGSATAVNDITLTNDDSNVGLILGSAADTVTFTTGLKAGTFNATLGAGNDNVDFGAAGVATGTITIDGGSGTDSITLGKVDNIIGATLNLTSIEEIVMIDAAQFNETHLSGKSYKMSAVTADDGFIVTVANASGAATVTTDLSGLTFNTLLNKNITDVTINGANGAVDIIKGTTVVDVIDAGTGADQINISNGGLDVIVVNAGDSLENGMDSVTGFTAAALTTAAGGDTLQLGAGTTVLVTGVAGVGKVTADTSVAEAINGGTGTETVTATLTNGMMSLAGVNADQINTLAEWIDAAGILAATATEAAGDTLAFKFNGNTYVYSITGLDATTNFDIVELVGVTNATAISTTDAANTIHIA